MADRLITAADVETWKGPGPIHVPEGVLITPSAADRAAELGVPLLYLRRGGDGALESRDGDEYYVRIPREPGAEFSVRVTETGCEVRRV